MDTYILASGDQPPFRVFLWDERFESGHQEVDQQHQQLVELVNALAQTIPVPEPQSRFQMLFQQLLSYAHRHFSFEESLFCQAHLSAAELAAHRQSHLTFIEKVTQYPFSGGDEESDTQQVLLDLLEFLVIWLAEHILIDDHRLVESLHPLADNPTLKPENAHARNAVRMLASTLRRLHDYVASVYQARISLHKSRFRLLAENAFEGYLWLDRHGHLQWSNRAFQQMSGLTAASLTHVDIQQLLQPVGRESLPRLLQRLLDAPQTHAEVALRLRTPGGNVRELASKWQVIVDDAQAIAGICVIMADVTSQNSKQRKLRLFRAVLDQAGDAMFIVAGHAAQIVDTNLQASHLLGYSVHELKSMRVTDLNLGLDTPEKWSAHLQALRRHKAMTFTDRQRCKDGHILHVEISARVMAFDGEEFLIGICRDITARIHHQHKERLRNKTLSNVLSSHARQEDVLDDLAQSLQGWLRDLNVPQCQVYLFDACYLALYPHPRHADIPDYPSREQVSRLFQQPTTHHQSRPQALTVGEQAGYLHPITTHQGWLGAVLLLHSPGFVLQRSHINAIGTATQLFRIVANKFAAELALRQREEHEAFAARHDALTGLSNRLMLFEFMPHAQARAKRTHSQIAVIFIDIDHFKAINDNFGHALGDQVLVAFAQLIRQTVRDSDLVCRLSGDEFLVVMENIHTEEDVTVIADKLVAAMQPPLLPSAAEGPLTLSASIGIALYPRDGEQIDTVIHHADDAMYQAKRAGRGHWRQYP